MELPGYVKTIYPRHRLIEEYQVENAGAFPGLLHFIESGWPIHSLGYFNPPITQQFSQDRATGGVIVNHEGAHSSYIRQDSRSDGVLFDW